jgi:hypothetical protein
LNKSDTRHRDREWYAARDMTGPLGRRPEDAWLTHISNKNG